jgi:hypothetical protein
VREAFGDITWEPREIVDLGDRVLVRVHLGEGAVRLDIFRTWEEARRATGPRE